MYCRCNFKGRAKCICKISAFNRPSVNVTFIHQNVNAAAIAETIRKCYSEINELISFAKTAIGRLNNPSCSLVQPLKIMKDIG